jgi:hypothetical protein
MENTKLNPIKDNRTSSIEIEKYSLIPTITLNSFVESSKIKNVENPIIPDLVGSNKYLVAKSLSENFLLIIDLESSVAIVCIIPSLKLRTQYEY